MRTSRYICATVTALTFACAAGCAQEDGSSAGQAPLDVDTSTSESRQIGGKAAYDRVCAECHESGRNGAPVTGQPADWQDRSTLWQAVLFEHAREGFIDMPARGGDAELSDPEVEAAAEYMLSITYPGRIPAVD